MVQAVWISTHSLLVNIMKSVVRLAAMLNVAVLMSSAVPAQSPQDARITVAHPGFDAMKADLKAIMKLTDETEQKQWPNIEGYIDSFVMGLSGKKPFYIVVPTGEKPASYLLALPLSLKDPIFEEFRDNLDSLGYEFQRDEKDRSLFELDVDPDFGWLRVLADSRYALLILTGDKDKFPLLREIILKATLPATNVQGNMQAELVNDDPASEAQQHRREAFGEIRRVSMDAVKRRPEESATEFAIRTHSSKVLLDEGERLMAESQQITMVLNIDTANPAALAASLKTNAVAIPGTTLAAAIAQIGTQPDAFASLAEFEGSALSLRLNHPIDPMRQTNILEFLALTEQDMADRLKSSKERSESEKEMTLKCTKGVLEIVADGIKTGYFNAFVEAVPDGHGDFFSIAGFAAPTASKLNDVLPMLTSSGNGNVVEMNIDKSGDVTIHRVQLAEGYSDFFDRFVGKKKDIFVGVGTAHVWLASGAGALDRLKSTIAGLGQPAAVTSPLHIELHMLPWVQWLEDIAKTEPEATLPAELELQRNKARQRARAIASFADSDAASLDFTVQNGEVIGELKIETGLLRFVGKMMAAYSKANLE